MSVATSLGDPCIADSAYSMDLAIASAFACAASNSASDRTLVAGSLFHYLVQSSNLSKQLNLQLFSSLSGAEKFGEVLI